MLIAYNMADQTGLKPRTIRLSDKVWKAVERRARQDRRTVSDFLRVEIEELLKRPKSEAAGGGAQAA
jgi:hypothetical protein